jgi:(E)-4-hydroxy-3-methyl-but-2-enyl pyrophosphate reductase
MSVRLAKTAGFCMGVKRAVDIVLEMAQKKGGKTFYTFGPLIHNPQTIQLLEKRGIIPVRHVDDIEEGDKDATIVIRAHGISPEERRRIKERNIRIIDATCPKVAHVQAIIKKHAKQGCHIVIVGDPEHPEVNGLLGYAGGRGSVVCCDRDVDPLNGLDRVCVVAQTTQNQEEYGRIVALIKAKFPETVVFDTICDSTEKRQTEVRELSSEMDVMVIVGGRNSANTMRLAMLSEAGGTPTYHIETVDELKQIQLKHGDRIGISAGASTPNWIIDRVVEYVKLVQGQNRVRFSRLRHFWAFSVMTDIYASVGAGCLAFAGMLLQKLPVDMVPIVTTALFVFSMHTFNRVINPRTSSILGSFREETYQRYTRLYMLLAVAFMTAALILSLLAGLASFILLLCISVLGVLYNTKIMPASWRFESLKDLPGSKNVFMAAAWALVAVILPQMTSFNLFKPAMIVAFLFIFSVVFIRSAMSDMLDIQSDKLIGRETIPVLIGKGNTQKLLKGMWGVMFVILLISHPLGWASSVNYALLTCLFYIWICLKLCDRRTGLSGVALEGILETSYLIAGVSAFFWLLWLHIAGS